MRSSRLFASLTIVIGLLTALSAPSVQALEDVSELFNTHKRSLYQIKVLDVSSDSKSSYGTGFAISKDGYIATNYHVISQKVLAPDDYRLQYRSDTGDTGDLEIISVDVVNDLAIVKLDGTIEHYLNISADDPVQGNTIYSLGNPRDLGMIVSPGTYNGLKEHSFYPRIHFTGSVNPGMSGGPVINEKGEVVGVNVATGGNALGFLVPLQPLTRLIALTDSIDTDLTTMMRDQLVVNQQQLYSDIFAGDWPQVSLGDAKVPSQFTDYFSCWGNSNSSRDDSLYLSTKFSCYLTDNIYIEREFQTGSIEVQFHYMQSKGLSPRHFYNQVRRHFGNARAGNRATSTQVDGFQCKQARVETAQLKNVETVYCVRPYKKLDGLFDALYISAHIGYDDRALISHYTLSGVDRTNAEVFLRRFSEAIQWP